MNYIKTHIILILLISFITATAGNDGGGRTIVWKETQKVPLTEGREINILNFENAVWDESLYGYLPVYMERFDLDSRYENVSLNIIDPLFEELIIEPGMEIEGLQMVGEEIKTEIGQITGRNKHAAYAKIMPVRKNSSTGKYERLISFVIDVQYENKVERSIYKNSYVESSVLSLGSWYKLRVNQSGVYRITYQDLTDIGSDPSTIDPQKIRIFGNGAGMLPEANDIPVTDDLNEIAIHVEGSEDGTFDPDDYILFYGEASAEWEFNPFRAAFEYTPHLYSDFNCYFLNFDSGVGKRIEMISSTNIPVTDTITTLSDYAIYNLQELNLIKSGKIWYSNKFSQDNLVKNLQFNFPNIVAGTEAYARFYLAARSSVKSYFTISSNGTYITEMPITGISPGAITVYGRRVVFNELFPVTSDQVNLEITYDPPTTTSMGWINFVEVNVNRHLIFEGTQMMFRDIHSFGRDNIGEYIVSNGSDIEAIWEITDPGNVKNIDYNTENDQAKFRLEIDSLRQFVAYDGTAFLKPEYIGAIENQDLHSLAPVDMVIITPDIFREQAERLANIHRTYDQLSVAVVDLDHIYNEFSSGIQDIAAIRNFMRMLYNQADSSSAPRYLQLFGNGSYDPKDRHHENTNFIPTFQSAQSLSPGSSFVSDDFFGLLDEDEGHDATGALDIGIGRFPVRDLEQAKAAVDKIEHYITHTPQVYGNWRNIVCFIADDEDQNMHFKQAEELAQYVRQNYPEYNIDKIYHDSYQQITTPGGKRYPEVNARINDRVNNGALIINYTGHGGETGWSEERVVEIADINAWSNWDRLPLFITATCEFSRFDDPEHTSAGELVFLNQHGGGIALFTTTRLAFATSNFNMNKRVYEYIFKKENGEYLRIGDIFRFSKVPVINSNRNIVLLGDPALRLTYPEYNIIATSFNGESVAAVSDTARALTKVTVEGEIVRSDSSLVENFNGILSPEVFDKEKRIMTIGNDPKSYPAEFFVQNDCIYRGKVTVKDGKFSFSFIIPKDIFFDYGNGKISFYANNDQSDACGYWDEMIIGGLDQEAIIDNTGPEIDLFMNREDFVAGDILNPDPLMYVYLSDESGINALGNGIGHDITLLFNDGSEQYITLNDYFEPDLDSYQSGKILFPFSDLANGSYTLRLKAWDLHNNSSTFTTNFLISDNIKLAVGNLLNYPNPFTLSTKFAFDHNQYGGDLKVEIKIFDINGRLVNIIGPVDVLSTGYQPESIEWDGKDLNGNRISAGVYIYKMRIDNNKDLYSELSGKLIVVR
jgi:hypothetical protein